MTVFSHDSTPFRIFFTRTRRLQARFAKNSTATGVYSPSLRSPWRTASEDEARKRLNAFMNTMYHSLDTLKTPQVNDVIAKPKNIESIKKN